MKRIIGVLLLKNIHLISKQIYNMFQEIVKIDTLYAAQRI
jgi:hypothetical protein